MGIFSYLCTVQWNEGLPESLSFSFLHQIQSMIDKKVVENLVNEWLTDRDYFLVSVEVSTDNRIVVEIDPADGVWIDDCVELSKYIE